MIGWNRYGKSRVRLVKLDRRAEPHALVDLTIDVQLEGDFEPVYEGDNRLCLATDTMKNTVYALARQAPIEHVEAFAVRLADHFVGKPAVTQVDSSRRPNSRGRRSTRAHGSAPARVSRCPARSNGPRSSPMTHQQAATDNHSVRRHGSRRDEDERLRIRRISPRRVYDPARHRGPHSRDVDHRELDVS